MPITRTPRSYSHRVAPGVTAQPRADVVGLAVEGVPAGPQQHDVERLERVADARQGGLHVRRLDLLAVGLGGHVEDDAVGEEPFQRQLVDGRGPMSLDLAVVVPGGIDVGDAVRAQLGELLDRPALAVAEQPGRHAEQGLDLRRPLGVTVYAISTRSNGRTPGGLGAIVAERSMIRMRRFAMLITLLMSMK